MTSDPRAVEIAAEMVSRYLAGDRDGMTDPAEGILDDPRLLGAVVVHLTVIAGEILRTATVESGADPQAILRDLIQRHEGFVG